MKQMIKQGVTLLLLTLLSFSVFAGNASARNYGEGEYGAGKYGIGEEEATPEPGNSSSGSSGSSNGSSGSSSSPSCDKTPPGTKTPWLYGAIPQGANSILLQWAAADEPVDHYALEFGSKSGEYIWGATTIGDKNTRAYIVKSLNPNTTYYFRVRAGNGCATGNWSNEISTTTRGHISYSQLEITDSSLDGIPTTQIATETKTEKELEISCKEYTVKAGDTLWGTANEILGDGNKYKDIIEQNKDTYPSLLSSNNLKSGWKLQYNCEDKAEPVVGSFDDDEEAAIGGYAVTVKVIDTEQNPVEGAKVAIHSKVQEAVTDNKGMAKFTNVEPGDHRVLVAYNGFEGEQTINLSGDVKEFNLHITIEQKSVLFSPLALTVIGALVLIVLALIFLLAAVKKKL